MLINYCANNNQYNGKVIYLENINVPFFVTLKYVHTKLLTDKRNIYIVLFKLTLMNNDITHKGRTYNPVEYL